MNWGDFIKHAALGISVATAAYAARKLQQRITEYKEVVAPRAAQPFLRLGFHWVGDLKLNMIHPPEIVFDIGNREHRLIYLDRVDWFSPSNRLSWDAKTPQVSGQVVAPGQGLTLKLDPCDVLEPIASCNDLWGRPISQIRFICGLRLAIQLRSGERLTIGAPRVLKIYLAHLHGLPLMARCFIRFYSYMRP